MLRLRPTFPSQASLRTGRSLPFQSSAEIEGTVQDLTGCETRELLFHKYQELLEQHVVKLSEVTQKFRFEGDDAALSEHTNTCVAAREELHRHEADHACCSRQVEAHV